MEDGPKKPKVTFADEVKVRIIDSEEEDKKEYLKATKQNDPGSPPDLEKETSRILDDKDSRLSKLLSSISNKRKIAEALQDKPDLKPPHNDEAFYGLASKLRKYPGFLSMEEKFEDLGDIIGKSIAKIAAQLPETTDEKYARSVKEWKEKELKLDPNVNIIKQLRDRNIDLESFEEGMRRESRKISGDTIIRVKFKDSSGQEKYAIISTDKFQKDKATYTHGKDEMSNNNIPPKVKEIAKNLSANITSSQDTQSPQTSQSTQTNLRKGVDNPR
jgi:hypothetical protein